MKHPLPSADKPSKKKGGKIFKCRKTSPVISIAPFNANDDKDYIPTTNAAPVDINVDVDDSVMQDLVEQHQ